MKKPAHEIIEDLTMVMPPGSWRWLIYLLLTGCLVAVALFLFWRRRRKIARENRPPVPPEITARERLAAIHHLIDENRVREFVTEASRILRYYIESRFGLRAPNLSTEEFLYEAEQSNVLTVKHRESLAAFLAECDLVKFALANLQKPEMESLYQTALSFVDQTSVAPVPPTPAKAG